MEYIEVAREDAAGGCVFCAIVEGAGERILARTPLAFATLAKYPYKDRKSTRLNSSHSQQSRMPSSA